jgi:tetrapyrrole methylase family protein/MazG family protein
LAIDPLAEGVRLVDGESFATDAAGMRGPLLVAQCWSTAVLSGVKLAADPPAGTTVTVLHHLGLADEAVWDVAWDELDRAFVPDHLTSLWIPHLAAPVAGELARLDELVHVLRARCPWDQEQTHGSLSRHLLEESYEVLEAIDGLVAADADVGASPERVERAVAHLEEELGDLLYQVYFHATLAAEEGRFSLSDVARGVHDKLVARHPHVFGDTVANSPDQVAANWEASKLEEKGRASVTEGIPAALPALALAAKLQRKAETVGIDLPDGGLEAGAIVAGLDRVRLTEPEIGELLFSLVSVARQLGIDPETALRARSVAFRQQVERHEQDR